MVNQPPPDPKELADQINELVEQLTTSRGNALADARSLQLAGQSLMDREEKRLARKLGADHPRVQQLRQRKETLLANIQGLEFERQMADIRSPKVEETEALVQGRIIDELGKGIAGLRVQLLDENGKMLVREPATTDLSGFYAFRIDPELIKGERTVQLTASTSTGREVYRPDSLQIGEGSRITLDVSLDRSKLAQTGEPSKPGNQPDEPPKPDNEPRPWMVKGMVSDPQGNPIEGILVQVTSSEIKLDKPLGTATTNRKGLYQISVIPGLAHGQLKPGVPLTILLFDPTGQQIYASKEKILFEPGEKIEHDIQIKPPGKKVVKR